MRPTLPTRHRLLAAGLGAALLVLLWTQLDLDGDGLSTEREWATQTDSLRQDTDGDTIADGWEVAHRLSPRTADTDADTLDDRAELARATDPLDPDSDHDGVTDPAEFAAGTDPRDSDSDDDTLGDALEAAVGTDPLLGDTEGDGLPDPREVLDGADPWSRDTDRDGIADAEEPRRDCDGDGRLGVASSDDDADQRGDGAEPAEERCDPDVDDDAVLDGLEANARCIRRADCDGDGLGDGAERGTAFSPLHSDTFGTGLNDAIALAFQQRDQPPSGDADDDGIPDAWETSTGLLAWDGLQPVPGQRDLLVEFVRVQGPDSGRFAYLDFTPAYDAVQAVFVAQGIRMRWAETVVTRPDEQRPSLIPSSDAAYYQDVLARAAFSTNPYVTTVVMNPQHDQSELLHAGVAPIRGTLAAVDYGQRTTLHFTYPYTDYVFNGTAWVPVQRTANLDLSPIYESYVVGDRQDVLQASGLQGGGTRADGDLFLQGPGWTMAWRPFWFAGSPTITLASGTSVTLTPAGADVDTAALAHTILHEVGHTLGLCHAHLADCAANFTAADRARADLSTMSYASTGLMFLPSEWATVGTYLTCPPQDPLAQVARGASAAAILDAKYNYPLADLLNVDQRKCGVPTVWRADLVPELDAVRYAPPYAPVGEADLTPASVVYVLPWAEPGLARNSLAGHVAYLGASAAFLAAAALAAPVVALRLQMRRGPAAGAAGPRAVPPPAALEEPSLADALDALDLAEG